MKKIEILFRRLLLFFLILFQKRKKQNSLPEINRDSKILFIRLNRIGDALVTTPLLSEIKKQIGCKIYVLASTSNYFVFQNELISDEIIIFHKNLKNISSLIKIINEMEFDVIVDLHDDVSSTVSYLTALGKSKYKFGLIKSTEKLFTHTVNRLDPSRYHIVERILEFAKLFNLKIDYSTTNIVFAPSSEAVKRVESFIENKFKSKKFLLGINISSGNEARYWGTENFKQFISELNDFDINLLLLCAEKDLHYAMEISNSSIPIFYRSVFEEFCTLINYVDLLFTPDTSIIHIASAFEKPVFGLYVKYRTNDKIWSPYKSQFEYIMTEESTLHNVTVQSVKEKFLPFLEKILYGSKN